MKTFFVCNLLAAIVSCTAVAAADLPPPQPQPGELELPFKEIGVRAFGRPFGETSLVITTPQSYRTVLGAAPPTDLDFDREWVVLYAAGTKPTGGYEAHIARIVRSPAARTLTVETRLVTPGPRCFVTEALTNPYVVARFRRPPEALRVAFVHSSEVRDCPAERPLR
jgi:hypothetical protein